MQKRRGSSVLGIVVAAAALVLGLLLDGGGLTQILQPAAALVVLGGTAGALLVQFPFSVLREAFAQPFRVRHTTQGQLERVEQMSRFATQARRKGLLSLDGELAGIADPFLQRALTLAVDGLRAPEIQALLEAESDRLAEAEEQLIEVWEAAGGFAPTLGIVGAVLGLIQVMGRLDSLSGIGHGIATAFVATLYGVGAANLLFIPVAGRLRHRAGEAERLRMNTWEGVVAILEGANLRLLRERMGAPAPLTAVPPTRLVRHA